MIGKKRFLVPAKILELCYTDDAFFSEVMKIKKVAGNNKFPKNDEWRDEDGFNISFALAGYSSSDVVVEVEENVLIVRGDGIDSIEPLPEVEAKELEADLFQDYSKLSRPRIHIGSISRGIARRKFCSKYLISEEFDVASAVATMEFGLLHIFIPEKKEIKRKMIEIMEGKNDRS